MDKKLTIDNKEANEKCIAEIITRIQEIDDTETVGAIASQDIIDIVIENLGPEIYNKALVDAGKLIDAKSADLSYELDELKQ